MLFRSTGLMGAVSTAPKAPTDDRCIQGRQCSWTRHGTVPLVTSQAVLSQAVSIYTRRDVAVALTSALTFPG